MSSAIRNGISSFFDRVKRGYRKLFYNDISDYNDMKLDEELSLQESFLVNQDYEGRPESNSNNATDKKSQTSKNTPVSLIQNKYLNKRNAEKIDSNSMKSIPESSNEKSLKNDNIKTMEPLKNEDWNVFIKRDNPSDKLSNTLFRNSNYSSKSVNVKEASHASSTLLGKKRINCILSESSKFSSNVHKFSSPHKSSNSHLEEFRPSSISAKSNINYSNFLSNSEENLVKSTSQSNILTIKDKTTKSLEEIKKEIEQKKIQNRLYLDELKKKEESRNQKELENKKKVLQSYSDLNASLKSNEINKLKFKSNLEIQSSIISINNEKEPCTNTKNFQVGIAQKIQTIHTNKLKLVKSDPFKLAVSKNNLSTNLVPGKDDLKVTSPNKLSLSQNSNSVVPKSDNSKLDLSKLNPNKSTFFHFDKNKTQAEAEMNYKWDIKSGVKFGVKDPDKSNTVSQLNENKKSENFVNNSFNEVIPQPPVNDQLLIEEPSEPLFTNIDNFRDPKSKPSLILNEEDQPNIIEPEKIKSSIEDTAYMPRITLFGLKPSNNMFSSLGAERKLNPTLGKESDNRSIFGLGSATQTPFPISKTGDSAKMDPFSSGPKDNSCKDPN